MAEVSAASDRGGSNGAKVMVSNVSFLLLFSFLSLSFLFSFLWFLPFNIPPVVLPSVVVVMAPVASALPLLT